MPRQTHGRTPTIGNRPPVAKRKTRSSRTLNAYAIAQQELPTKIRVRRSRLGEIDDIDDGPRIGYRHTDSERPAKRSRLQNHGAASDDDSAGHDSPGNEWHIGVEDGDQDSELDSDEAMGESDEERFEGLVFRGSSSQSVQRSKRPRDPAKTRNPPELDLQEKVQLESETEDGSISTDEDGLGESAVDLASALDQQEEEEGTAQSQRNDSRLKGKVSVREERDESNGSHDDDDVSSSADERSTLSVSEDEDTVANNNRLKSFVDGLERQEMFDPTSTTSKPPLALGEPSDHGLAPSQKLTIADLLPTVTDPRLRESLKMLHNSEQRGSKPSTGAVLGKLDPPLPKRQQDKLDREAAYEKSKGTLGRWVDTVKHNRRAEHISFPLPDPAATASAGTNQLLPISESKCPTSLESTIQSILHESGLASKNGAAAEKTIEEFESIQQKKIPVEEAQFRRAELRKARELMFREEIRARRIKKIKSKAYRRVHRKEREKHMQTERGALAAAGALDPDAEREKQDRQRAEERMGRRHRENRWAKAIKATGRAAWDEDARSGVNDMVLQDEALRRRIEGQGVNQSDQSDAETADDGSSDDVSIDEYDEVKDQMLKRQLQELESTGAAPTSQSRLSAMPFMRKAESIRRGENQAEIEQTVRLISGAGGDGDDRIDSQDEAPGRQRFGIGQPGQAEDVPRVEMVGEFEEPVSEGEPDLGTPASQLVSDRQQTLLQKQGGRVQTGGKRGGGVHRNHERSDSSSNPWLSGPRDDKSQGATKGPILQNSALTHKEKKRVNSHAIVQTHSMTKNLTDASMDDWTSPSESEAEAPKKAAGQEQRPRRNEELVRMAFAGDDVFKAFADEKKATVDEEGDQVVDNSLPGWGSWTGAGISKSERRFANSRKATTTIKGVDPRSRKDARLERVIINEKRSKKNARYLAPELPHPFESRQQYERSLRLPLGPEWSTKTTFQDATKPRVLLKQGIIRPMEKPMI